MVVTLFAWVRPVGAGSMRSRPDTPRPNEAVAQLTASPAARAVSLWKK
ncbi:hypothetical protein BN2475_420110 [Paraburkholderia ribeironis]|uniref:Uncharacterized protein n=1 Tax=Paraburkholderia ribeironis TaxID=1247936 RepID=A0A1N7S7U9_9BURK|nr:hypothetical protein BN2475_420110 [Paraburkholderia ribeironis]